MVVLISLQTFLRIVNVNVVLLETFEYLWVDGSGINTRNGALEVLIALY